MLLSQSCQFANELENDTDVGFVCFANRETGGRLACYCHAATIATASLQWLLLAMEPGGPVALMAIPSFHPEAFGLKYLHQRFLDGSLNGDEPLLCLAVGGPVVVKILRVQKGSLFWRNRSGVRECKCRHSILCVALIQPLLTTNGQEHNQVLRNGSLTAGEGTHNSVVRVVCLAWRNSHNRVVRSFARRH